MKNTLLVLGLMLISFFSYGQIIQFADPNFMYALLNTNCVDSNGDNIGDQDADENNDKEIDSVEAEKIQRLFVNDKEISSLSGIEFFTGLQVLHCNYNQLKSLNVANLTALQEFQCHSNQLTSLDVSNLTALQVFNCRHNQLSSIDVSKLTALQVFGCGNNQLTSLDVSNLPTIRELHCGGNELSSLIVSNLPGLLSLGCDFNQLTSLVVSNLPALKVLYCSNNQLTSLNLNNLPSLQELSCYKNKLKTLDVTNLSALQELNCYDNQLTSLVVTNLPVLKEINCYNNQLTSLEVTNLLSLQVLLCSSNKLSNLILSNLPALDELSCYENQLTTLDVSNLPSLYELSCYSNQLTSLHLSYLPALQDLNCGKNKLTLIDVSSLTALKELNCQSNKLTNLDVSNLLDLKSLYCNSNLLTSLDVSNLTFLEKLNFGYNNLISINVSNLSALQELWCIDNRLSSLDVSSLTSLRELQCGGNQLTSLDVFGLTALQELNCDNSYKLVSLKVSNLPSLQILTCYYNKLSSLVISNLNELQTLNCSKNQLSSLILSNLPSLKYLVCNDNQLTTLDVSNITTLLNLNCNNNQLASLKIKNGIKINSSVRIDFDKNPTLKYLCCDEKNIEKFENSIKFYGYTSVEVNTYCNFDPSGIFSDIFGKIKYDFDNNGCGDSDILSPFNKISLITTTDNGYIIGDESGNYNILLNSGSYIIKPEIQNPDYYTITPDSIVVSVSDTLRDTIIQDFCITPKNILKQVDISIIPLTPPARPGFDAKYKVVMTNKGNQIENGTLYFAYDETKMDFVSTDVNPSTQSDGLLSWNFSDLLPFETRYYNVTLNVNSPSETPPVNAGDELLITCNILDNVFLLKQEVVGSYDPNDKTCLEGKTITPEQVGEYVYYLIRFENTGNYAAENVVVKDVIDASTFDISTLQITDASHEAWARINGNIVEFIFENIQLPFDDATNDGYICFKIKTKPTLFLGNELKNEANIYFDYNLPILTNKTNTVVANLVGTDEAIGESDIEIFPNPVSDVLRFSGDDKILKVEIFDMSGKLLQVSNVEDREVNVERLLSGAYQMKVYTQNGVSNCKMVKL